MNSLQPIYNSLPFRTTLWQWVACRASLGCEWVFVSASVQVRVPGFGFGWFLPPTSDPRLQPMLPWRDPWPIRIGLGALRSCHGTGGMPKLEPPSSALRRTCKCLRGIPHTFYVFWMWISQRKRFYSVDNPRYDSGFVQISKWACISFMWYKDLQSFQRRELVHSVKRMFVQISYFYWYA